MWFSLALTAAFCWAFGGVLLKPAYKRFSPSQIYFVNGLFFCLLWLGYALVTWSTIHFPTSFLLLLPALPPLAFLFFIFALEKEKVSVLSAVISTSPIVSSTLGVLLLKEELSLFQAGLITAIVIVLFLLGLTENKEGKEIGFWGYLLSITCSFLFGVANFTSKFVIQKIGPVNFSLVNGSWMIVLGLFWLIFSNSFSFNNWKEVKSFRGKRGLLGDVIYSAGGFFLFLSLSRGPVSLVIPVSNLSVPLTILLANLFLKERLTKKQITLIMITAGLVSLLLLFR